MAAAGTWRRRRRARPPRHRAGRAADRRDTSRRRCRRGPGRRAWPHRARPPAGGSGPSNHRPTRRDSGFAIGRAVENAAATRCTSSRVGCARTNETSATPAARSWSSNSASRRPGRAASSSRKASRHGARGAGSVAAVERRAERARCPRLAAARRRRAASAGSGSSISTPAKDAYVPRSASAARHARVVAERGVQRGDRHAHEGVGAAARLQLPREARQVVAAHGQRARSGTTRRRCGRPATARERVDDDGVGAEHAQPLDGMA